MSCAEKLYINKDHEIIIAIKVGTGFSISDISTLSVTLRKSSTVSSVFTLALGGITVSGQVITLIIDDADITVSGIYKIIVDMVDTGGKKRGLTPCPDFLTFFKQG